MSFKKILGMIIVLLTISFFVIYIKYNPQVLTQIRTTNLITIILVLTMYSLMTIVLIVMSKLILKMSGLFLNKKENAFLTMYSSIINFFGPLQSGPGFRIIYLKKKHKLSVREYFKISLLYYLFFALISGLFLLNKLFGIPITLIVGITGLILITTFLKYFKSNKISNLIRFDNYLSNDIIKLFLLTVLQLLLISIAYFIELRSVDSSISFRQALIYCGAANFSLFVSLTPGALGIRESFIFFSQKLHDIPTNTIVSTSILDRSLYILFLGLMFGLILILHGREYIKTDSSKPKEAR